MSHSFLYPIILPCNAFEFIVPSSEESVVSTWMASRVQFYCRLQLQLCVCARAPLALGIINQKTTSRYISLQNKGSLTLHM